MEKEHQPKGSVREARNNSIESMMFCAFLQGQSGDSFKQWFERERFIERFNELFTSHTESTEKPDIIKYLLGEKDYEGKWFGESTYHITKPFWWRTVLREHLETIQAELTSLRAQNKQLQDFKDYVHKRLDDAGVPI